MKTFWLNIIFLHEQKKHYTEPCTKAMSSSCLSINHDHILIGESSLSQTQLLLLRYYVKSSYYHPSSYRPLLTHWKAMRATTNISEHSLFYRFTQAYVQVKSTCIILFLLMSVLNFHYILVWELLTVWSITYLSVIPHFY